ncbi:MAG: DUF6731 family protein [Deferribacterales bacterium]
MAERKNVTINFYKLESAVDTFYQDMDFKLEMLSSGGMDYGFFDGKGCELMFKVYEPIKLSDRTLHLVGIVKEKIFLPVRFNREGEIQEAVESPDSLGDVSYGLIDTENGCILTLGGRASNFSDFVRWLSGDASAGTHPLYRYDAYTQVLNWEIFRKVNLSIEAPAADFVGNILNSEIGENFKMLETLSGLKIDISVSMGHGKGSLHKDAVRDFLKAVLEENFAGKLKVSGKSFEEQATEEIDLIAARVRHKAEIVIAGTHIAPDEAKATLYEAYQLHLDDIEAANEKEGIDDEDCSN